MKTILLLFTIISSTIYSFDQSHALWTKILSENTQKKEGMIFVNYKKIKKNSDELKSYLKQLSKLDRKEFKKFTKEQKLAFWINVYNAYTVKLIIENYPLKSIKDIKGEGGFLGIGSSPWKIKFIPMFKKKISLDNVEHDIIRKQFKEPRIHFAVNCASIGCPSLAQKAFTAENLDSLLNEMSKSFLSNKNKNKFDIKKKKAEISKIFSWYGSDFDEKYGSFKKFIEKLYPEYKDLEKWDVDFVDYNWNLNDLSSK